MSSASAKILLLEDDPSDRKFMHHCLSGRGREGVELHHAMRLEEAGVRCRQEDYQLVIADLSLPDAEGLEALFKVRELAPGAAIVVMTGLDDGDLAMRAVQAGAQDYLVKGDLPPERVWRSVSNALARQSRLRQLTDAAQDLRKRNNSLRDLAHVDPLTGLLNRRGFIKALARPGLFPPGVPVGCALLVDVDDFKKVNDLFGYSLGDLSLREIGRRIRALTRPGDVAARIGGDEFLILSPGATVATAMGLAERIRGTVAGVEVRGAAGTLKVTVSVGVAALPHAGCPLEDLLELTHGALRMSKGAGKNRLCFSGDAAREAGEPGVVKRPFYDLKSGEIAGHAFLPASWAGSGRDGTSMSQVHELARAAALGHGGLECHLHLSHIQLLHLDPDTLAHDCGSSLDRRRVRLAIPEVPMSPLPPGLLDAVRRLQRSGWILALSGLGLGPHTWGNLIQLEPAAVGLDPALVSGAGADEARLRGLVRLCRALGAFGAYAVADGIESATDLQVLRGLGVTLGTGPFMSARKDSRDPVAI